MKKKNLLKLLAVAIVICLPVLKSWAQTEITTPQELIDVKNNLGGNYKLMNDIDLSGITDWVPIGMTSTTTGHSINTFANFTGTFDGQGYAIKNLTYSFSGSYTGGNVWATNQADDLTGGIFARITGTVKNLKLVNLTISGNATGALAAGLGVSPVIDRISVIGCTLSGDSEVGGIIARTNGTPQPFTNCYVDPTTTITGGTNVGGIVGYICQSGVISMTNCYVAATMSCTKPGGSIYGLLGGYSDTGTGSINLKSVFVLAQPSDMASGTALEPFCLPGANRIAGASTNYFACSDYFPLAAPANAKTLSELQDKSTYVAAGWDFDNIWEWDDILGPSLIGVQAPQGPIAISDYDDLLKFKAKFPRVSYLQSGTAGSNVYGDYYLTNDITIPEDTEWQPLGMHDLYDGTSSQGGPLDNFAGTFDGKGYAIKGLKITKGKSFTGFFARIAETAIIKNLTLEDVQIIGGQPAGSLAGTIWDGANDVNKKANIIQNVSVTGSIKGISEVGGIVGRVNGNPEETVTDCYVNADVEATDGGAGGIAGCMNSGRRLTINNVYVAGTVKATTYAGGILGFIDNNQANTLFKLDASAVVASEISGGTGTSELFFNKGAHLGTPATLTNNYARNDIELTSPDATLQALDAFKAQDFYKTTLSWDFDEIWQIKEGKFPIFQWQEYDLDTSAKMIGENSWNITGQNNGIEVTAFEPLFLSVFDVTGKTLFAAQVNNQISIPTAQGIYILKLKTAGKEVVQKLIVK